MNNKLSTQKTLLITACAAGALMMSGCSDSDNDTVVPPSTNLYTLNASGGIGGSDGGSGGDGDYFQVEKYGVGDIVITNKVDVVTSTPDNEFEEAVTSVVDYSAFTPRNLTGLGDVGDVPMMVTADTTLTALTAGDAKPAAGTFYQLLNNNNIYVSNGDANTVPTNDDAVTGINIASGTTLTLGLNRTTYTQVSLSHDLVNHGVLTKDESSATTRGGLRINAASYIATGDVNNQGTQDAQDGGYVDISANYSVFNQGNINASGADSAVAATDAGDGDYIILSLMVISSKIPAT